MSKLKEVTNQPGLFLFNCPGCKTDHFLNTNLIMRQSWMWNGSVDAPTASPSILIGAKGEIPRCHFFMREGKLEFLNDCHHELAGQTVEIPDYQF